MTLRAGRRMDGVERTLIRQIFDSAPAGAINLGLGQPDLPTPERIGLRGIRAIREGRTAYGPTAGDATLRAAIARRHPRVASGPDGVVVTIGSQEAMFASLLTLVDPGDEVLVPDPGYPAYASMVRLIGGVPVAYPLRYANAFRVDPDEVAARLGPATRAFILCNPSNPTGAVERAGTLDRLGRMLHEAGVAWISDEIYASFVYDGPYASLSEHAPAGSGLVVSSLSKDLSMTGWRLGWVAGDDAIVARIVAAHQYVVTCASSISQHAAIAAFEAEGDLERASHVEVFRRRRALMAEELAKVPGIRFHLPDGAFYFFVDVSAHGASLPLCRRILERRGVITIAGEAFGGNGDGFLRISYAAPEDRIVEGIRAIAQELREKV